MKPKHAIRLRCSALLGAMVGAVLIAPSAAHAERPATSRLLPDTTVALLSIPSAPTLAERFMNTSIGRMSQDPQLKPLVQKLYGSLTEAAANAEKAIGLSISQILAIPQGELTIALSTPEDTDRPALILLLDAGDHLSDAHKLIEVGTAEAERRGAAKSEETVEGTKLTIFEGGGGIRRVMYFEKDNTIVIGTHLPTLKQLLSVWNGAEGKTLSKNTSYAAIMERCQGTQDEPPQVRWFVDPISLVRATAQQNTGAQVAMAMLPTLGLDGLLGIGGSMTFDAGQFDSLTHLHVLLENPRSGVVKMIAFESGDMKPEPWVPADVAAYMTLHWNIDKTYTTLANLVDSFRGQGAFAKELESRILGPTGIDFEKDVIKSLEGRASLITLFERPARAQSQAFLVGLKLKKAEPLEQVLEKVVKLGQGNLVEQSSAGKKFYQVQIPQVAELPPEQRPPQPCFGILDDYLLVSNSVTLYQKAIGTAVEKGKTLADELDFKLVASKIRRQSGGSQPAMISFDRPEESVRFVYDLATDARIRERLSQGGERNPFFRSLNTALEQHPLPPFAVLQQYLAPGGAMLVDDETGLHYMTFSLRRKGKSEP